MSEDNHAKKDDNPSEDDDSEDNPPQDHLGNLSEEDMETSPAILWYGYKDRVREKQVGNPTLKYSSSKSNIARFFGFFQHC